jgi:T5SS/PEP-CTERM-associated repeat protein/autotransporter-associated beta strand protein
MNIYSVARAANAHRRNVLSISLSTALALAYSSASASDWTGGTGDWFDASNWSSGVPASTVGGIIANGGTAQISASSAQAYTLEVGKAGNGAVTIRNGGVLSVTASSYFAAQTGDIGDMLVDGAGSNLIAPTGGNFWIGVSGTGHLTVTNGGSIDLSTSAEAGWNPDGQGTVLIDGTDSVLNCADSNDLRIGSHGAGSLTLQNGGSINMSGQITLGGFESTAAGTLLVDGAGTILTNPTRPGIVDTGEVFIGHLGTATMTVRNGATANVGYVGVGFTNQGSALVDGAGTHLTASDSIEVASSGVGDLKILNGGSVDVVTNGSFIGGGALGRGTALVDGPGSTWTSNPSFSVAGTGVGTLTVRNGGSVVVTGTGGSFVGQGFSAGVQAQGIAVVDGAGSSWTDATSMTIGDVGVGMLTLRNGGRVSVNGGAGPTIIGAFRGDRATGVGTLNFGGGFMDPETPDGPLETSAIIGGDGIGLVNFNRPGATSFSTPMQGTLSVAKLGAASTLTLLGAHSYTGTTTVAAGTLVVQCPLGDTETRVQPNAKLEGTGSIGGAILLQPNGTLSPGVDGPGMLAAGGFEWNAGGLVPFQLGAGDADSDLLALNGQFVKQGTGTYRFDFSDGGAPPTIRTYTLITFTSSVGFDVSDFSYAYTGSQPNLQGSFELTPTALLFHIGTLPVELQSFTID